MLTKTLSPKMSVSFPRIVDRYVFMEVLLPFLGGVLFFAFIFLMFQMLRLSEFFIVNGVSLTQLGKIVGYMLVSFLPLGLPISFLVAILTAFGRFSSDSEMVAMKASGLSLLRISAPVQVLAVFVAILSLLLNMNWAPNAELSLRKLMIKIGNAKFSTSIQEGTFTSGFMNMLLFTERANNRAGKMENVFIFDERDPAHPLTVISKNGELIRIQRNEEDLGGLILQLTNGSIHQSATDSANYNLSHFDTYQIYVDIPDTTGNFSAKPKMYSFAELVGRRNAAALESVERYSLDTELWRRVTVALTPFMFVLLGIGLGTVRTRGARFGVILIAFVAMAAYWQVQVSSIWLGNSGYVLPALAMQIPNFLVGIFGIWAFRRAGW